MHQSSEYKSSFKVDFSYRTLFTRSAFSDSNPLLADIAGSEGTPGKVFFIIDRNLTRFNPGLTEQIKRYAAVHYQKMKLVAEPLLIDGSESCKNFDTALSICRGMLAAGLCRQSYAVIVGGGALLDAAGFAAAIFHRGIRQIRIPTTALSQCDSGVGVKNAVNHSGKKNLIGTFAPPWAVISDFDFIRTLPYREIACGAAEALKVALIKDADFFSWLIENAWAIASRDMQKTEYMIEHCAKIHIDHIAGNGDPFEFGSARPLDFGHWAAHKIEMMSGGMVRHGEAVATGLLLDTKYAVLKGITDESVFTDLANAVRQFRIRVAPEYLEKQDSEGKRAILGGIEEFREHLGGELHITLPTQRGSKIEVTAIDSATLEKAIEDILSINFQN